MLKNLLVLTAGLVLASFTLTSFKIVGNVLSPFKTFDSVSNLPAYSRNQDFSQKEFLPIVRIETKAGFFSKQEFHCSGTVISDDYVLTAAHCVGGLEGRLSKNTFIIKSASSENPNQFLEVEATAASMNGRGDYALIRGDFKRFTKVPILLNMELNLTTMTGPMIVCGYPWGAQRVCYATDNQPVPYYEFFFMHGLLYPGMSGGPVYDRGIGKIVAVNSAMTNDGILVAPLVGLFETLEVEVVD